MPRQPLLPTHKNARVGFPVNALAERPEIAKLVGECINLWTQVDVQLALVLSAILKANSEAGIAIFLSIRNARVQRETLNAAATAVLDGDSLETFSAISNVYKSLEAQRNDLAHGVFLTSPDLPDGILWMDAKEHTAFFSQWLKKMETDINASLDGIRDGVFFYRKKDLESLRDNITELWQAALFFWQHLRARPNPSAQSLQHICNYVPCLKFSERYPC